MHFLELQFPNIVDMRSLFLGSQWWSNINTC
jgi:hypothetical protein